MNPNKKNIGIVNDEVEELLKAAEDAALLKLNINAHKVHGVSLSSDLNPTSSLQTIGLGNMKPNDKKKKKKKNTDTEEVNDDEVEELLRAAEDEALLRLSVNAHGVRGLSSDLHPDLHHRFQALKAGPKTTKAPNAMTNRASAQPPPQQPPPVKEEDEGEDDLFARFAALKACLPKPSSSSSAYVTPGNISEHNASGLDNIDDEDEEDEVEKVIRWAKDAARLDPSPPSDEDDDIKDDDVDDYSEKSDVDDDGIDDDSEKSDADDDRVQKNPKGRKK